MGTAGRWTCRASDLQGQGRPSLSETSDRAWKHWLACQARFSTAQLPSLLAVTWLCLAWFWPGLLQRRAQISRMASHGWPWHHCIGATAGPNMSGLRNGSLNQSTCSARRLFYWASTPRAAASQSGLQEIKTRSRLLRGGRKGKSEGSTSTFFSEEAGSR